MPSKKSEPQGKYRNFTIAWEARSGDRVGVGDPKGKIDCKYSFNGFGVLAVDEEMRAFLQHLLSITELELGRDCVICPLHDECVEYVEHERASAIVKTFKRPGLEPCARLAKFLEQGGAP